MMNDNNAPEGRYVEENFILNITEVCQSLGIQKQWIFEVIDEGIIHPLPSKSSSPKFDQTAIRRIRTSICLQRDLGINLSGIALVLDLLDEIEELKNQSS